MNKSLTKAAHFAKIDPDANNRGSQAFVALQERGKVYFKEHFNNLTIEESKRLELLNTGWHWASVQVIMWLDDLVMNANEGFEWYWFYDDEYMGFNGSVIDDMIRSLRKSIKKYGLHGVVKRNRNYLKKPSWQSYVQRMERLENNLGGE